MQKIGVFGGTFNPIHNGHILLAKAFIRLFSLNKMLLIPTAQPPHKDAEYLAAAQQRLAMCRLAAAGDPAIEVSDIEIARGGRSYTIDTLKALHGKFPNAELYLIMGADMFLTLGQWFQFDRITKLAVLCTTPRDSAGKEHLLEAAKRLETEYGARTVVADLPLVDVSSTAVRAKLLAGESVIDLVPAPVAAYIYRHGLYRKMN